MASFLARTLRAADLQRMLDLAPGREILGEIPQGAHTWNVWLCEDTSLQEDLVAYLKREITPYFRWLSGGNYVPQFRYGRQPSAEVNTVLQNCQNEPAFYSSWTPGAHIFVGGNLWQSEGDVRVAGRGGIAVDPQSGALSQNVWIDKRSVYYTAAYAHEIGHAFGWPHILKNAGSSPSDPLQTEMDIMGTRGDLVGTNAHNLFHLGWIDPEKVALHSEGTATYTLSPPHSKKGTELLMLPLGPDRLISVGARAQRRYDWEIPLEGVELFEITLCRWWPLCKDMFLPPGTQSIRPVVLDDGDSWTARVNRESNGIHYETRIRISVTDQIGGSYTVKVEWNDVREDRLTGLDMAGIGACGVRESGAISCWGGVGVGPGPEGPFTSVALGHFGCAIRAADAGIECWNGGSVGEVVPAGEFSSVSAMLSHGCGLRKVGTVACWGWYPDTKPAAQPPDGQFVSVSAGLFHACGIRTDRIVECWGRSGNGESLSQPPSGEFTFVSSGANFSCGLRPDKSLTCWHTHVGLATGQPPSGQYTFVASGWNHGCAIRIDGAVVCWGHDDAFDVTPPDGVFTHIDVGYGRACGLRLNGASECWGTEVED